MNRGLIERRAGNMVHSLKILLFKSRNDSLTA